VRGGTVEGREVVLFYLFLEEELAEHEFAFGVFVDGVVVNGVFELLEVTVVTGVAVEMGLRGAVFVGGQAFEDGGVGVGEASEQGLHVGV
jgi:hypothetical protein